MNSMSDRRSFSERYSLKPKKIMQETEMNADLRNSLYNAVYMHYLLPNRSDSNPNECKTSLSLLMTFIWLYQLKLPLDERPHWYQDVCKTIKTVILKRSFSEVYDLLQFIADNYGNGESDTLAIDDKNIRFRKNCNDILREEMTPYQFVDGLITRLTSKEEIEQVENALHSPIDTVKTHIATAHKLLADKNAPDYRNSIKESISAVESICYLATGEEHSFTRALDLLAKKGIKIPGSLKIAFEKLYGWSSSESGIRHALLDEPDLDHEDALLALVTCSAFVNYLVTKVDKAGIQLTQEDA